MRVLISSASLFAKRHLSSNAFWWMLLLTPILAHFLVPDLGASYSVLTIDGAFPALTPSIIGFEIGIILSMVFSPIAYLFLRAGITRKEAWQITDVMGHSRILYSLGKWLADCFIFIVFLAALTLAAWLISIMRLGFNHSDFLTTSLALWLPALPALVLIAAIRRFCDSLKILRSWLGEVAFFIFWIMAMSMSMFANMASDGDATLAGYLDPFGFAYPVIFTLPEITSLSIGFSPGLSESLEIDISQGLLSSDYLITRLWWVALAAGLAFLSGAFYQEGKKTRSGKTKKETQTSAAGAMLSQMPAPAFISHYKTTHASPFILTAMSEARLLFPNRLYCILVIIVALSGLLLPFRSLTAPALFLLMLFPAVEAGGRGHGSQITQFFQSLPLTLGPRLFIQFFVIFAVTLLCFTPAISRLVIEEGYFQISHGLAIAFLTGLLAVSLGFLTKGPMVARLILLLIWYVYFASA